MSVNLKNIVHSVIKDVHVLVTLVHLCMKFEVCITSGVVADDTGKNKTNLTAKLNKLILVPLGLMCMSMSCKYILVQNFKILQQVF